MSTPPLTQTKNPHPNEPVWTRSEKAIARTAFDAALKRELHGVMQEAKRMASQISKPDDLGNLERFLTERRKDINGKYDFRSSLLTCVFGKLLFEERLSESELRGLGEDELEVIRSCAKVLSADAA